MQSTQHTQEGHPGETNRQSFIHDVDKFAQTGRYIAGARRIDPNRIGNQFAHRDGQVPVSVVLAHPTDPYVLTGSEDCIVVSLIIRIAFNYIL